MNPLHHRRCHHTTYGLTCADFDELYAYAEGTCHICGTPEERPVRGRLVIDHHQRYGARAVRGLLCDRYNAHLRRVDSGEVKYPSDQVTDYFTNAWFVRHLRRRPGHRIRYRGPHRRDIAWLWNI